MEFTTPQQHNEYLVGRLLTIACKARPSLESHFRKFMNRPDLLLPMMWTHSPKLTRVLRRSEEVSAIMNEMTACEPLFNLPSNGNALVMGSYHQK
jgi:hypothetical protein